MGRKKIDLFGKVFNRLTVIEDVGRGKQGHVLWRCECSCGNSVVTCSADLRQGNTQSCGCLMIDQVKEANTTHGLRKHPLYNVWLKMKDRCFNPKANSYENYGGRGITVCDRWKDSLENFIEDVYPKYKEGLQLDRINNDGNYEPDNVRWVTNQQNSMNRGSDKNSSSKYKGVCWNKGTSKWQANIQKDGKLCHLGLFTDERDAAVAYNKAANDLFGEFANLNKIEP